MQKLNDAPASTVSFRRRQSTRRGAPAEFVLWLTCGLAVALFTYSAIVHHYLSPPAGYFFSGAIQDDQQYYMVLARSVFSLGNGFVYGNPFYLEPCTARYYSHLFIVLVAWVHKITSIDIDKVFQGLGFIFCIAMYGALYALVKSLDPKLPGRNWMFLFAAFGGGLGWIPGLIQLAMHGHQISPDKFVGATVGHLYMYGWWLDSVMTTSLFPTECFYHCLFFLTLACLARRRLVLAAIGVALTWWAHGIYGVEISVVSMLFVATDLLIRLFSEKRLPRRKDFWNIAPISTAVLAGSWYYLVYLTTIPEHFNIVTNWRSCLYKILLPFYPTHYHLFLLAPMALLVMCFSAKYRTALREDKSIHFLLCYITGVFLMMNHNWFVTSTQPAHFSRGYLLVGLTLLTFKLFEKLGWELKSGRVQLALVCLLAGCMIDNLVVISHYGYSPRFPVAWLPNCYKEMSLKLQQDKSYPLLVGSLDTTAFGQLYLMRTCDLRTVAVHPAGPWFDERVALAQNFLKGKVKDLLKRADVSYVLADATEQKAVEQACPEVEFKPLISDGNLSLLKIENHQ